MTTTNHDEADRDLCAGAQKLVDGGCMLPAATSFLERLVTALQRHLDAPAQADLAAFSASDAAVYAYPGEDQAELRQAFRDGAAYVFTRPVQAPGVEAGVLKRLRDAAARARKHDLPIVNLPAGDIRALLAAVGGTRA